jgi:hypothetical protein
MHDHQTDYLVVGAGCVGLAFADTLISEDPDARVMIVDRHGKPGGHWNDAYPFVRLHQPSSFYGVNSLALGNGHIDAVGPNKGFYELASGPEVAGYFDRVMQQKLLPSGRVSYHPMCDYRGGEAGQGRFVSILSGAEHRVQVRRKTVDATWYGTTVPSTHRPKFSVAPGVRLVPPNALPQLWKDGSDAPRQFVIVGAGKTAMDAALWLLEAGAAPSAIQWVVPRDSWLMNRAQSQPGFEFFMQTIGGQTHEMEALAAAGSADELFLRLEAKGRMLRIDRSVMPTMFHYATLSEGEVELLRGITQVIRLGRVLAIEAGEMVLERGRVPVSPHTLFIDCSASAVERRPASPIFQGERIVLQIVRMPQPAFSAALVAWVEVHGGDDEARNQLCTTIPFPDTIAAYPAAVMGNMLNQMRWSQHKALREWIADSRLDWTGRVLQQVDPADAEKMALLARYKAGAKAAMGNLPRLVAA